MGNAAERTLIAPNYADIDPSTDLYADLAAEREAAEIGDIMYSVHPDIQRAMGLDLVHGQAGSYLLAATAPRPERQTHSRNVRWIASALAWLWR